MKTETVAQSFATYRSQVIPHEATDVQVEECRRAFYAGAYFLLLNVAHNIGDDTTSEDEGVAELEKLKSECETFATTVAGMPLPIAAPLAPADSNYTTEDAPKIRPLLQDLAARIGSVLPDGWGFNLLLFTYGEGGSLFYISSAERSDVIALMREYIKRSTQ